MHTLFTETQSPHTGSSTDTVDAKEVLEECREKAKERQRESGKTTGRGQGKVVETFPQPNGKKSRDEVGSLFNVSGRYVDILSGVDDTDWHRSRKAH